MEVTIAHKDKQLLVLRVTGVTPAYLNTLRRIMMTEVPVLAIEDVEFRKNSGALYDEIVAHRLGMLSIKTDLQSYNLPGVCKCKGAGCAQCQVKLALKATGPCTVYAEEFKSKDPKAVPVHGKTPIAVLLEGQELELEATAILGQGTAHAKWNPALVYYKEYPYLTIKQQPEHAKELAAAFPHVLEFKAGKLGIKEKALLTHDVHQAIVDASRGAITVEYKDDYLLYVETWEQLSPKDIVTEALNVFDQELEEVKALLKEA